MNRTHRASADEVPTCRVPHRCGPVTCLRTVSSPEEKWLGVAERPSATAIRHTDSRSSTFPDADETSDQAHSLKVFLGFFDTQFA